jgi:hypothetical protein
MHVGRVHEYADHGGFRNDLMQQFQLLRLQRGGKQIDARGVAAGPIEAGNHAELDRVTGSDEGNRNCSGRGLCRQNTGRAARKDHGDPAENQFDRQRRQPTDLTLRPSVLDGHVLALDVTDLIEALPKRSSTICSLTGRPKVEEPDHRHRRLLRAPRAATPPRRREARRIRVV